MFQKIGIIFLCLCSFCSITYGKEIPYSDAVQVIVGEAANQGLKGMICVAEVLRRRGSIKGFYGFQADRSAEPKEIWEMAAKAWKESASTNFTHGADHFDNVRAFGPPWWAKYCIKTYEYKDHVFYKEIQERAEI